MDRMVGKEIDRRAIYSALVTPYDEKGEVSEKLLRALVRFELDKKVEGFYCCGSSGEGLLLSNDERKKIVEVVIDEVAGQVPVIVHVGSLSTQCAVELAVHAEKTGACAVSAIPPIYYHYTQAEINRYYTDIADAVGIGVIVYNIPQFTGISFTTENPLLQNKRIIGIKHTNMNLYELERIGRQCPDKLLINGFDEIYHSALAAGATATIGTTVNCLSPLFHSIRDAFCRGDNAAAHAMQMRLNDVIQAMVSTSVFPAAKYSMELLGVQAGCCRRPFAPLTDGQKKIVRSAMDGVADLL